MGKQLAPEDPLFSGGGGAAGATAGGVDLDLEGGQSRVDFDLLGDPVPGRREASISTSARRWGPGADPRRRVTDRNAALLENSFPAPTGTTRGR